MQASERKELLKVSHITKQFGGLKAVNDVSFTMYEGEILGIIGPNGAGKTTFFNVISGFDAPTAGSVIFCGADMTGKNITQYCLKGMSRTFQNIRVFNEMSVIDNIMVGMHNVIKTDVWSISLHTRREKRAEAAALEKAHEILRYLGIDEFAQEAAGNLSYGYQRKVEIGRALAGDPKLILLDEPSAGMNDSETIELMELIRGIMKRGVNIIVIEHNMQFMMNLCDRIAVLNFGTLLTVGTPDEVKNNEEVIQAYLGRDDEEEDHAS